MNRRPKTEQTPTKTEHIPTKTDKHTNNKIWFGLVMSIVVFIAVISTAYSIYNYDNLIKDEELKDYSILHMIMLMNGRCYINIFFSPISFISAGTARRAR